MTATIEGYERKCEAEYQAGLEAEEARETRIEEIAGEIDTEIRQAMSAGKAIKSRLHKGQLPAATELAEFAAESTSCIAWIEKAIAGRFHVNDLLVEYAEYFAPIEYDEEIERAEAAADSERFFDRADA